ncbi:MAG TPA: MutL protein [Clostridiaceae bacterium]|nr:MutL protein [Clostridiaceae bacterium]
MQAVLLIDFGSTYTKLTAVDLDKEEFLGNANSFTTVETDINDGLARALAALKTRTGELEFREQLACSSAAGGLRMVVSGLMPELTAEAARSAALGAGAKVVRTYSHTLTSPDLAEIREIEPEIFLITGGTDGGNKEVILSNARALATTDLQCPFVYAGNRVIADEVSEILKEFDLTVCPNVMPRLGELNIEPVQERIRELFLESIVYAKGLSQVEELISNIMMPTPQAMLKAMELLARGSGRVEGIGDLLAIDLGGATTDVYSMASGSPRLSSTVIKGLPEPYARRTVEGDIGMRYSVDGIIAAAGIERVKEISGLDSDSISHWCETLRADPAQLPDQEEIEALDFALSCLAVETAVTRHAGHLEEFYTPMGQVFAQSGKDLRGVRKIIATGGSLIYSSTLNNILSYALYNPQDPGSLKPEKADYLIDKNYILSAMGVLSERYPDIALKIMRKELLHE